MAKKGQRPAKPRRKAAPPKYVPSLYDAIEKGIEYSSIAGLSPHPNADMLDEVVKGLQKIQKIRQRPCLAYIGNTIAHKEGAGIDISDNVPFHEMIGNVSESANEIDLVLATSGGIVEQVVHFVECLRPRFQSVTFLIPSHCMSAGTLFALSGDEIFMTSEACFGPIDPQMLTKNGTYAPAQALLRLIHMVQQEGQKNINNGQAISWELLQLLDSIDKKELGLAISQIEYSIRIATQYLQQYKLSTCEDANRADAIASRLADHNHWLNHAHPINSKALNEIGLDVKDPDESLEDALVRLWALCHWLFDKTNLLKMVISTTYKYCKFQTPRVVEYEGKA